MPSILSGSAVWAYGVKCTLSPFHFKYHPCGGGNNPFKQYFPYPCDETSKSFLTACGMTAEGNVQLCITSQSTTGPNPMCITGNRSSASYTHPSGSRCASHVYDTACHVQCAVTHSS